MSRPARANERGVTCRGGLLSGEVRFELTEALGIDGVRVDGIECRFKAGVDWRGRFAVNLKAFIIVW